MSSVASFTKSLTDNRWSLMTLLGGMAGVVILSKFWFHRHKLAGFSNISLTSTNSCTEKDKHSPYSEEKCEEYYKFIQDTLQSGSSMPLHLKKQALELLKFLSGFGNEQDRIREKKLIPILFDILENSGSPDLQIGSAFVISNLSIQPRNHPLLSEMHAVPKLFAAAERIKGLRTDALQLLLNLTFHQQNINDENLNEWDAVNRAMKWLNSLNESEFLLCLKLFINLSYIPFYSQQMKLDENLMQQVKSWCHSTDDEIRPRARLLKENLKLHF